MTNSNSAEAWLWYDCKNKNIVWNASSAYIQ